MLAPLFNFPVLMFLAVLPLMWLSAALLRQLPLRTSAQLATPLITAAALVLAAAVVGQLVFALMYLGTPSFSDHIEPNTAVVAWLYKQGGQLYHEVDAPARYSFLYGPVPYIASAWMYKLLGGTTLAAKLPGFLCLLVAMLFVVLAVRRRLSGQWLSCLVALGYMALIALLFKNHSFWSKPDPFMIAASAIGFYSCLMWPGRKAWLLCGFALGIAVNAKATGAVYFLPYLAWFMERDGYRGPFVALLTAAVVALLPFLSPEQVSLLNYIAWLQSAGGHGLSLLLLVQDLIFILFLLLPLGCFLLWQVASVGTRSWLVTHKLVSAASVIATLLIWVAASKPGSGPHHLLPFLPPLAFLTAYAASRVYAYRPMTSWNIYGFWAPAAAFLVAASIKAGFALYYGIQVVMAQANAAAIVDDLSAIMENYPDRNIYMGYGDGSTYPTTFVRHYLVYADNPYLVDAPALTDFQFSGVGIPESTIAALLADTRAVWLIPAGQEPFTMVNWYFRYSGGQLFDESFQQAFTQHFRRQATTEYFDLYVPEAQP
jgi:hypothetical protein